LLSHEQDEHEEQLEQELQGLGQQFELLQLSQRSCLRKRARKRSQQDGFSQLLSQQEEQVDLQQGAE